ncbi:MAG: SH3 domain-containing protein [Anaerolineae bacterium]
MKYFRPTVWTILLFILVTPIIALTQSGECSAVVKAALEATDNICSDTSRNQACYGHVHLEAIPQSKGAPFKFDAVGDRVDVAQVSSLRLSPLDLRSDVWGVALMRLQADIPAQAPDENVTLLVFGDVEVKNAVPNPVILDAVVKGPSNANIRRQPSNRAFVITSIPPAEALKVKGQTEDGEWLYVALNGEEKNGWVRRSLLKSDADMTELKVVDPVLASYGPMQAFFLKNGNKQSSCDNAPIDGILIQTPEGVAQVRLWINQVKIKLGSTAFIQASPDQKKMVINTLEGAAHVEALGVEQVAVAGTSVTVRLDENLAPVAPPSLPQAYDSIQVQELPVDNLERNITIASPLEETFTPTASYTPTSTVSVPSTMNLTITSSPIAPMTITGTMTTVSSIPQSPTTTTRVTVTDVATQMAATVNPTLSSPTIAVLTTDDTSAMPSTSTAVPATEVSVTDTSVMPATNTSAPPTQSILRITATVNLTQVTPSSVKPSETAILTTLEGSETPE